MEFEGTSLCFAQIWLSEGLSLERLTIQGGCWRVCGDEVAGQLNAGLSLCHTHTHTHTCFVSLGSHAERDRSGACVWGAAAGRHTDEFMKRYAVCWGWGGVVGGVVTRGHPCYQSSGVEPGPTAPTSAWHGAKATLKALSVPAQFERPCWDGGRGEGSRGITTRGCSAK